LVYRISYESLSALDILHPQNPKTPKPQNPVKWK
jgi:hypothetical protein